MKMVAAARMRRAQNSILSSRPFAVKMEEAVRDLALLEVTTAAGDRSAQIHPFFRPKREDSLGLIFITADKGLCGAFNTNLLRHAVDWLKRHQGKQVFAAVVGRKGRDFMHRLRGPEIQIASELVGVFPKASYAHAELVAGAMLPAFMEGKLGSVTILYNEFKSAVQQRVVETQLLPIPVPEPAENARKLPYRFEPDRDELLAALLPRHLKAQIYRALLESQAAELAARMNAMDSATKNASELMDGLTLWMNRTRQAIITREIAELVSGAEALAS